MTIFFNVRNHGKKELTVYLILNSSLLVQYLISVCKWLQVSKERNVQIKPSTRKSTHFFYRLINMYTRRVHQIEEIYLTLVFHINFFLFLMQYISYYKNFFRAIFQIKDRILVLKDVKDKFLQSFSCQAYLYQIQHISREQMDSIKTKKQDANLDIGHTWNNRALQTHTHKRWKKIIYTYMHY